MHDDFQKSMSVHLHGQYVYQMRIENSVGTFKFDVKNSVAFVLQ